MHPSSLRPLVLFLTTIVYHEDEIVLGVLAMETVDFAINAGIIATNQEQSIR